MQPNSPSEPAAVRSSARRWAAALLAAISLWLPALAADEPKGLGGGPAMAPSASAPAGAGAAA